MREEGEALIESKKQPKAPEPGVLNLSMDPGELLRRLTPKRLLNKGQVKQAGVKKTARRKVI